MGDYIFSPGPGAANLTMMHGKVQIEYDLSYVVHTGTFFWFWLTPLRVSPLSSTILSSMCMPRFGLVHSVCNLSDYPI